MTGRSRTGFCPFELLIQITKMYQKIQKLLKIWWNFGDNLFLIAANIVFGVIHKMWYLPSLAGKNAKWKTQIHSWLKPLEPYMSFFPERYCSKRHFALRKPKEIQKCGHLNWAHTLLLSSEGVLASVWDDKSPNISLGACAGLKRNTASLRCIQFSRMRQKSSYQLF